LTRERDPDLAVAIDRTLRGKVIEGVKVTPSSSRWPYYSLTGMCAGHRVIWHQDDAPPSVPIVWRWEEVRTKKRVYVDGKRFGIVVVKRPKEPEQEALI
jgi:hypothetical protein